MRIALVVLNLLVAAASAAMFGYTFFAREHLTARAEEYVVKKTPRPKPLDPNRLEAAKKELDRTSDPPVFRFNENARRDVWEEWALRSLGTLIWCISEFLRGFAGVLLYILALMEVAAYKQACLRFDKALANTILNVRIFSGASFLAALFLARLVSRATGRWQRYLISISGLLLFGLALQAYLFIDSHMFFRILSGSGLRWSYPLFLVFVCASLYVWFAPLKVAASSDPHKPAASGS